MPNVRPINKNKYEISKHRFLELYHHCMQYQEWKNELKYCNDTVKSVGRMEGVHSVEGRSSATEKLAIKRAELEEKCRTIEQTAIEADADIYQYIIEGVTADYASYRYLKDVMKIPCGKDMYYDRRRKFYWLLSKKI